MDIVRCSIQGVFIGHFTEVRPYKAQGPRLMEAELVLRRVGDMERALPWGLPRSPLRAIALSLVLQFFCLVQLSSSWTSSHQV